MHLIQENVPEVESIKDAVLKEIDFYAKPSAIIGSSTSGIMPTELQKNLKHPERLVVAHPFHPVYILPLVEIVPGQNTQKRQLLRLKKFMRVLVWMCFMCEMKLKDILRSSNGSIMERIITYC